MMTKYFVRSAVTAKKQKNKLKLKKIIRLMWKLGVTASPRIELQHLQGQSDDTTQWQAQSHPGVYRVCINTERSCAQHKALIWEQMAFEFHGFPSKHLDFSFQSWEKYQTSSLSGTVYKRPVQYPLRLPELSKTTWGKLSARKQFKRQWQPTAPYRDSYNRKKVR